MDIANPIQILDEVVYILHGINTLGNAINPTLLPSAVDK